MAFIPDPSLGSATAGPAPSSFIPDPSLDQKPGIMSQLAAGAIAPDPISKLIAAGAPAEFRAIADPIEAVGNKADAGLKMIGQAMQQGLGNPNNPNPMPPSMQALGYGVSKVAPYFNPIPKNDLGVALLPLMGKDIANTGKDIGGAIDNLISRSVDEAPEGITAGAEPLAKPNGWQKALGALMSAFNRVKKTPDQMASAIANPQILSDATPSTSQVSDMYKQAFEEAGMKIDDARYKFLTGSVWPLRPNQVGKAQNIVDMAFDANNPEALRDGLTETEAFVARTAAAKIRDSVTAATSPATQAVAQKRMDVLDNFLENSSLPQIRQLSRLWYMAKTKEALQEILPLNKNGSSNALSTILMGSQFKQAAENLAEGSPGKALGNALTGSLMSPYVGGLGIKGGSAIANNPGASAQLLNNALGQNAQGQ